MRIVVLGGGRTAVGLALAAAGARTPANPRVDVTIVARDPVEAASLAPDCRALRRGCLPLPHNVRLASLDTSFAASAVTDADGIFCALPAVAVASWLDQLVKDDARPAPVFLAARGAVNFKNAAVRAADARSDVRPNPFRGSMSDDADAANIFLPHELLLRPPAITQHAANSGSPPGPRTRLNQALLSRRLFSLGCMGPAADLTAAARHRLGVAANLDHFRTTRLQQRARRGTSSSVDAVDGDMDIFPSLPFLNIPICDAPLPALPLLHGGPVLVAACGEAPPEACDAAAAVLRTIGFAHTWIQALPTGSSNAMLSSKTYSLGRIPTETQKGVSPPATATTNFALLTVELLDAATLAAAFGGGLCARAFGSSARAPTSPSDSHGGGGGGGVYMDPLLNDEARLLDPSSAPLGGSVELARGAMRAFVDQLIEGVYRILQRERRLLHSDGGAGASTLMSSCESLLPQPARDALILAATTPGANLAFELGRRVYDAAVPSEAVETLVRATERHRYDTLHDSLALLAHAESASEGVAGGGGGAGIFTALLHVLTGYRKAAEAAPKLALPAALWVEHVPASRLQEGLEMIDAAMHRGEAPEPIAAELSAGLNLTANVSDLGKMARPPHS